jgi:hypothetical protein
VPTAERVKNLLIAQRADDTTRVPLSASHCLETWHRRDERSRHELAALMRDVSRYDTLAPVHLMQQAGVEWHMAKLAAPDVEVPTPASLLLGRGVNHAFGSPTGHFRVVSSIADDSTPEGAPADVPQVLLHAARTGESWEWFNLAGSAQFLLLDGIEVRPEHRRGRFDVEAEMLLRQRLLADKTMLFDLAEGVTSGADTLAERVGCGGKDIDRRRPASRSRPRILRSP